MAVVWMKGKWVERTEKGTGKYSVSKWRTVLDDEIQTLCCLPPVASYLTPRSLHGFNENY